MNNAFFGALLASLLMFLPNSASAAASAEQLWREVRETDIARTQQDRQIVPQSFRSLRLDVADRKSVV